MNRSEIINRTLNREKLQNERLQLQVAKTQNQVGGIIC